MHKYHYDLERFTLGSWDGIDNIDDVAITIPREVLETEEADHVRNVRIASWIEALSNHEVGQDLNFAPNHTYASLHQDEVEGRQRQQQWLALFYETKLFAGDMIEVADAAFGLEVQRNLDPKGDIMFQSVMLTSALPLGEQAEEEMYRRIVKAAEEHAAGNSAITSFADPRADATTNTSVH